MINILSVENMRASDEYTVKNITPGRELMFRAGKFIFEHVIWKEPVAIVCGSGNNAGDGYVVAGLLQDAGVECTVFLISEKFSEDGKYYFEECIKKKITTVLCDEDTVFENYATVLDCIFGTGFNGDVRGLAADIIKRINEAGEKGTFVVSADINSGLNGNSGMSRLCVHSDITVSIGGYKPGHFLNMAKDVMKEKLNADIGINPISEPYGRVEAKDAAGFIGRRKNFSNKGTYGYTALIGGSLCYSGAIRLAYLANAAMRAGAGVVKVAIPKSLCPYLLPVILESTAFPLSDRDGDIVFCEEEAKKLTANVKTVAFGMGIGVTEETEKFLVWLLKNYTGTLIVDADGLSMLAKQSNELIRNSGCRLVLTPHVKEFSRLTGCGMEEIFASPVKLAEDYAKKTGAVVLLKGPSTIITDGEKTRITDAGCPGMATAGSGDVLSGIAAATCASVENTLDAATLAAYINGKAGELAQAEKNEISMTAGDTVFKIPQVISEMLKIKA